MEAGRIKRQLSKFREDLSANTSIHGIVWTTGAASLIGRLIWGVIVMAAAGVLIYQIYDRASTYLSYPVSVDISVKIAQSLTFPAITVCNTNAFKISAATENDLYEPLYNFYINGDAKRMPTTPSLAIKKKLAHDAKDFIFKCTFLGEDCTPKKNESTSSFEQIATNFGICYTFNGRNDPVRPKKDKYGNPTRHGLIRTITQTGAPYGLQLELNIEAYEAMPGPQGYGGIKILPHSPYSVPQISELGLSVPATRSAFVGLTAGTTIMLPSPWGHCAQHPPNNTNHRIEEEFHIRNKAEYTKSRCELNCYARLSADKCLCSASFMPRVKETPICDIVTEEGCVMDTLKLAIKLKSCSGTGSLDCPYQCNTTIYTAALTYGSLSEFELIRRAIKLQDESKPSNVVLLDQYQNAMGIRHQKVRALYVTEKNLTETINQDLNELMQDLDPEKKSKTSIKSLIDTWKNTLDEKLNKAYPQALEALKVSFSEVRKSFGRDLSLYAVKSFVSKYEIDCKFAIKFLEKKTNYVSRKTDSDKKFHRSFCSYYKSDLETAALTLERVLPDIQTEMQHKKNKTERYQDRNYREIWLAHYSKINSGFREAFSNLTKNLSRFRNIMNTEFCQEASSRIWQVNGSTLWYFYKNETERGWDVYKARKSLIDIEYILMNLTMGILNSDESLSYQERLVESLRITLINYVNSATTGYENANHSFYELLELCSPLQPVFQDLKKKFAKEPPPKKEQMIESIDEAMSTGLGSNRTNGFTEIFDNKLSSLKSRLAKLLEHMDEASEGIKDGVGRLNDEYNTTTFTAAAAHLASIGTMKNHLLHVKERVRRNSEGDSKNREDLVRSLRDLIQRLSRDFEQRIKQIDSKFVEDNFVKLSVYFTSMQTTSVSSKKAYEAFSLICDVGGTAGLWLGASMISVIEVFYFLCKHIGIWYDNRDTPADDSEKNGQVNKMAEFSQADIPGYSRPSDYADNSSPQ